MVNYEKRILLIIKKYGNVKLGGRKLNVNDIIHLYEIEYKPIKDRSNISNVLLRIKLNKTIKFQKQFDKLLHVYWV